MKQTLWLNDIQSGEFVAVVLKTYIHVVFVILILSSMLNPCISYQEWNFTSTKSYHNSVHQNLFLPLFQLT